MSVFLIIVILVQKLFSFLFSFIFLLNIKSGLYPYYDIQDSFISNVVSSNALFSKVFLTLISIVLSILSIVMSIVILKLKKLKYLAIVLLIISSLEITFLSSRFLDLNEIVSLVENCDFHHKVQVGCSIPQDF